MRSRKLEFVAGVVRKLKIVLRNNHLKNSKLGELFTQYFEEIDVLDENRPNVVCNTCKLKTKKTKTKQTKYYEKFNKNFFAIGRIF